MKRLKMVLKSSILLSVTLGIFSNSLVNASAWGGYAHWEMGQRIANKYNYTEIKRLSFSSGDLLADLGRLSWDIKYTSSDSEQFTNRMLSLASDENSIKFADGWKAHYIQDTQGALSNIDGGPSSYRVKSGWVDEYLRDDIKINSPINNTHEVLVDYDLIRGTYDSLHGFNPSNEQIDKEIKKMYVAFDLQILANFNGWNDNEKKSIEKELDRTVELCMNNGQEELYVNNEIVNDDISDSDMNIINNTIEKYVNIMENSGVLKLEKARRSNEYIVNYSVLDKEKYEDILRNIYNDLTNEGIDISKI